MNYSIVIAVYNEAAVLPALYARLAKVMDGLEGASEVIFVNDGSHDASAAILRQLRTSDPRVKIITLSRNFGQQFAFTAGLDYCSGEAIILMDADLQDPPEVIPELIAKWCEGYDIVYALRERREGESAFKRLTAHWFYRGLRRITHIEIPADTGDFRLISRRALDALCAMREQHRFLRGMVSWCGFSQAAVTYVRAPRQAGETKYTLRKMAALAMDGITSFSTFPLRLALYPGILLALASAGVLGWMGCCAAQHHPVPAWAWLLLTVLVVGAMQMCYAAILGSYLGRIYDEVRARPLYIVCETEGFAVQAVKLGHAVGTEQINNMHAANLK
jgi:dolichol-phosphate mannosyltransferase